MTRSIAFAPLALLLIVGQVSAECAWVLWEHTRKDSTSGTWVPNGAVTARQECEVYQAGFEERYRRFAETLAKTNPATLNLSEHSQWICLPDTVDPRGLKGGGR